MQPDFDVTLSVKQDESTPPIGIRDAAWLQAGGTICVIGGEGRTDSSYNQSLVLNVLPDGAAVYDASVAGAGQPPSASDTIGDRSYLYCQAASGSICHAFVMIGDWLVDAWLRDTQATTLEEAVDYATSVFTTVAGRIAAAGPARELWTAPASAGVDGVCDPSALGALLGTDLSGAEFLALGGGYAEPTVGCLLLGGQTLSAYGLAGGGWAFHAIAASPDKVFHRYLKPGVEVAVAGTDGALLTILDGNAALIKRGDDLLQVSCGDATDEATAIAQLETYLAAIP